MCAGMKNEVTIRRAEPLDLPYLYDICLRTGDNGEDASALYRDPYLVGRGWGRSLMETLFGELRRLGIPGVHLGVSAQNAGAIAFYGKMGFGVLGETPEGKTLGLRLRESRAFF